MFKMDVHNWLNLSCRTHVCVQTTFVPMRNHFVYILSSEFSLHVSEQILLFSIHYQLENKNFNGMHTGPELISEFQTTCSGV